MKIKQLVPIIVFIALVVFPFVVRNDYYQHLMILILMWVTIGSAVSIGATSLKRSAISIPPPKTVLP